jgi:uncharacterized protein YbjT (DUF2867 family)
MEGMVLVSAPRRVLVIGGSRGTGLLAAELLVRRGVPVRVLARDPVRAAKQLSSAVEVIRGDITRGSTLSAAVAGVTDIVFTAGVRSGHPARQSRIIATDHGGVINTLAAARDAGLSGRFAYMTSMGVSTRSLSSVFLNLIKGNTLLWRRRAEEAIRASGLSYAIVRAGFLLHGPAGTRALELTQRALPLSPRYRIARADVAEALVTALDHPRTTRATFEVYWGEGPRREGWQVLMESLTPDQ